MAFPFMLYCPVCGYHMEEGQAGVNSCPECGKATLHIVMGNREFIANFIKTVLEPIYEK